MIVEIFLATAIKWTIAAALILAGFAAFAMAVQGLRMARAALRWCWRVGRRAWA